MPPVALLKENKNHTTPTTPHRLSVSRRLVVSCFRFYGRGCGEAGVGFVGWLQHQETRDARVRRRRWRKSAADVRTSSSRRHTDRRVQVAGRHRVAVDDPKCRNTPTTQRRVRCPQIPELLVGLCDGATTAVVVVRSELAAKRGPPVCSTSVLLSIVPCDVGGCHVCSGFMGAGADLSFLFKL